MDKRPIAFFDMEVYPNYVLCAFRTEDGRRYRWSAESTNTKLPRAEILAFIKQYTLITFNGSGYDIPLLMLVIRGETVATIKKASDRIILHNLKPWNFEKEFHIKLQRPEVDHIDLMEVAPLTGSLKLYAAKCHSYSVQDLPVDPTKDLTPIQMAEVEDYCFNDLLSTGDLYNALKVQIEMRTAMSATYGIDLRSKSDAQMAEAIIKSEVEKLTKTRIQKPGDLTGASFVYQIPQWMHFWEIDILGDIQKARFMVNDKGRTVLPDELKNKKIEFRGKEYRMGIGGLHSSETKQIMKADEMHMIMDFDVASYYPSIVLNEKLYPKHIGSEFLQVYRTLVNKRLEAKKRAAELTEWIKASPEPRPVFIEEMKKCIVAAEGLKICVNGTFGKLGSKYSVLYSPDLMIQVTITGQLALLMLIESLAQHAEVISANTDGVTVRCERTNEQSVLEAVEAWTRTTGFKLDRADYAAIYARDVNNYIVIKTDGTVKTKGEYGKGLSLHKNPVNAICGDALIKHLTLGTPIEDTINQCNDLRQFVSTRTVKGGAKFRGEVIGKVARWYHSIESKDSIYYACNNHLVPATENSMPLVIMPMDCPEDLDRAWYINETKTMLGDMGVEGFVVPEAPKKKRKKKSPEAALLVTENAIVYENGDVVRSMEDDMVRSERLVSA